MALIILLAASVSTCVSARMHYSQQTSYEIYLQVTRDKPMKVAPELRKYVRMFRRDARIAGYDPGTLLKNIKRIEIRMLTPDLYGFYDPVKKIIVINRFYVNKYNLIKKVMYHEIGHSIGLKHCHIRCWHIMGTRFPHQIFDKKQWKLLTNEFFNNEN